MFEVHYNEEMEAEVRRLEAKNAANSAVNAESLCSCKESSIELNAPYAFAKELDAPFKDTEQKVRAELSKEGEI
jgi:hypothetical protein